jgi:hypothetical protein
MPERGHQVCTSAAKTLGNRISNKNNKNHPRRARSPLSKGKIFVFNNDRILCREKGHCERVPGMNKHTWNLET